MSLIKSKIYSLGLKTAIYISVIGGVILSSTRVLAASFVPGSIDTNTTLSLTVRQNPFLGGILPPLVFPGDDWAATFFITETQGNILGYDTLSIDVVLRHLTDPHQGEDGGGGQIRLNFFLDSTNARGFQKTVSDSDFAFHPPGRSHVDRARGVLTANITTTPILNTSDISSWTLELDASHNVPEPLTMLGAATALGYGALLKRKYSENKKS
jgi:hypothetical protein